MGAILLPLITGLLSFLFRTVMVKFVIFAVLWVVTTLFLQELITYLPDFTGGISSAMSAFSSTTWFILDTFGFSVGFPLVISAFVARFAIRRIPFIG